MSRIAVVGAGGFIGSNVFAHALKTCPSAELIATHRPEKVAPTGPNVRSLSIDLDDPRQPAIDADVAIYCAGASDHGLCYGRIAEAANRLARFAEGFKGHLILISSGAVYYNGSEGAIAESARINPTMPYGIAKRLEEIVAEGAFESGRISRLTILRLFYAYGPRERPSRLMRRVIAAAKEGYGKISIPSGRQSILHPVHVDDFVEWIFRVVIKPGPSMEVLNVAGPEPLAVGQVIARIGEAFGADIDVVSSEDSEPYPVHYWSDSTLQKFRGFVPRPFLAGVRSYAEVIGGAPVA